jgi:ribosomal protein RSM22 (predicted rRNA methylase)
MSSLHVRPPPESLLAAVSAVAREQLGKDDLQGAALAQAVLRVSEAYRRQRGSPAELRSDEQALCARLKFFLPRDFPKIEPPLAELASVGALPTAPTLRVLDLGAGLGTSALGAAAFVLRQPGIERVTIDAVDQDARALGIAERLSERFALAEGLAIELSTRTAPLNDALLARLQPPYHLILLGFVLNELGDAEPDAVQHHVRWLSRLSELLADDGAIVVLEPALRQTSRRLQAARSVLAAGLGPPFVFAPCLHRGACPLLERERDWCHEQLPLQLPAQLLPIARIAGLRGSELTYSYLTLLRSARSLAELDPNARLLRVVSAPLRSKGKLELLVCGEGSTRRLRRLDRRESDVNRALGSVNRGSILRSVRHDDGDRSVRVVEADSAIEALQVIRSG